MLWAAHFVLLTAATSTQGPASFPDIPKNHWVYQVFGDLKGIGAFRPVGRLGGTGSGPSATRVDCSEAIALSLPLLSGAVSTYIERSSEIAMHGYGLIPGRSTSLAIEILDSFNQSLTRIASKGQGFDELLQEFQPELIAKGKDIRSLRDQWRSIREVIIHLRVPEPGEALRFIPNIPENHGIYEAIANLQKGELLPLYQGKAWNWSVRRYQLTADLPGAVSKLYRTTQERKVQAEKLRNLCRDLTNLVAFMASDLWQTGQNPNKLLQDISAVKADSASCKD